MLGYPGLDCIFLAQYNLHFLKKWVENLMMLNLWASLLAQLVKNPPVMQETLVQFLGQEDLLEKG